MKFARLALAAISSFAFASVALAEDAKDASPVVDNAGVKQYVVSFHDEVSMQDFEAASKWITENKGEILESINENFAKLIIAKMDDGIMKLTAAMPQVVESVEEDDLEWDAHDDEL